MHGKLPRADCAIFADTGKENSGTYAYLEFLLDWQQKNNGIPIRVLREKNLYKDLQSKSRRKRFASIPAFTRKEDGSVGMLRRQCTAEYKILVINDYIRDQIYQLPKRARRPVTAIWQGISLDEADRMSEPREAWKINVYPFLGRSICKGAQVTRIPWAVPMNRSELQRWYRLHNLPVPPKSSCVFCPYQSDRSWAMMKKNAPQDFAAAVLVDKAIRNSTRKGIYSPAYLHHRCKPLQSVVFDDSKDEAFGECSGTCHI